MLLQAADCDLPANAQVLTLVLSILYTLLLCLVAGPMQPGGGTAQPPSRAELCLLLWVRYVQACAACSTQHGRSSPAVC